MPNTQPTGDAMAQSNRCRRSPNDRTGIKEKVLAARRAGIHRIVLPRENGKNLRDLPDHVRKEMEFVLVDTVYDVVAAVLPQLAERIRIPA